MIWFTILNWPQLVWYPPPKSSVLFVTAPVAVEVQTEKLWVKDLIAVNGALLNILKIDVELNLSFISSGFFQELH